MTIRSTPQERALDLEAIVREHADAADQHRRLSPEVAAAFSSNGLYRIGAPKAFGGEEADPKTQIETIEIIPASSVASIVVTYHYSASLSSSYSDV